MKINEKYSRDFEKGKLDFPEHLGEKTEKDFLSRARYMFGMYCSNQCSIGYNGGGHTNYGQRRTYKELRDYGRGMQPHFKYRDILDPKRKGKNGRSYRRWNISWDTVKIMVKFKNIMKSMFKEINMDISTVAVDETASLEKDFMVGKMKMAANPNAKKFMQEIGYKHPAMDSVAGMTPSDVDTLNQMGGLLLQIEIMMKDAIDHSFEGSEFESMSPMLIEDIIDLNAFAMHTYVHNGFNRIEYVDPDRLLTRASEYPDCRDSDMNGFIKTRKVSEIREWIGDDSKDEELYKAARGRRTGGNGYFNNQNSNFNDGDRRSYAKNTDYYQGVYNEEEVEVLTLYFIDREVDRYVKGSHPRGNKIYNRAKPGSKGRKGQEIDENIIHYLYKVNWVVGTDIVYDFGKSENIVRTGTDGNKKVINNIYCYLGQEPSIVERCISHIDDLNIAKFKERRLISKLPPGPRLMIDKSAMKHMVKIGQEEFSVLESYERYAQDGIFIIESQGDYQLPGTHDTTTRQPMVPIPSGIVEDMAVLSQTMLTAIDMIQQETGMNSVADGTNSNPDLLKGVMEGMKKASNNAIAPYIDVYVQGYEKMAWMVANKTQLQVLNGDIDLSQFPVNGQIVRQTILTKDLFYHVWSINITVGDMMTKQFLLQSLTMKENTIPQTAYFEIYNMINAGDLKKAQLFLAKHTIAAEELAHKRALEVQQVQAKGNSDAAVATQEAEASRIATEYSKKGELALLQEKIDNRKRADEWAYKKRELDLQGEIGQKRDVKLAQMQKMQ